VLLEHPGGVAGHLGNSVGREVPQGAAGVIRIWGHLLDPIAQDVRGGPGLERHLAGGELGLDDRDELTKGPTGLEVRHRRSLRVPPGPVVHGQETATGARLRESGSASARPRLAAGTPPIV
jgi:hypothetical protein